MEAIRIELTDIAKELLVIGHRLYRVQEMIRETQIIPSQESDVEQTQSSDLPDVIYLGIQHKRTVIKNGDRLVIKRRMRRHCPICNARFGCKHV